MPSQLQMCLDPLRLAAAGARVEGWLGDASVARINRRLAGDDSDPVSESETDWSGPSVCDEESQSQYAKLLSRPDVELAFTVQHNQSLLKLRVSADVRLICQRCLEPVTEHVVAYNEITLLKARRSVAEGAFTGRGAMTNHSAPDRSQQNRQDIDPDVLVCEAGVTVDFEPILIDEFLLAVPMVALHGQGRCAVPEEYVAQPLPQADNPFAALASLVDADPVTQANRKNKPQPKC